MNKVLVTGGAGFIGSHVTDFLIDEGTHVVILDNLSSGDLKNINKSMHVTFIEGDVRDTKAVQDTFERHPEIGAVVHMAAQSKVGPSIENPHEDLAINVSGTLNLLEEARKKNVKTFVYASSAAVYGHVDNLPVTEETPTRPLSPYGVSKLSAEEYVKAYSRLYDMNVAALRFANVYGPRQSAATEAGVITIFIERLLAGEQPVIQGDGQQTRDFIYVEDVARAVMKVLEDPAKNKGAVFNVSSETSTSVEELLRKICGALNVPFTPDYTEERPGDIKHSYLSREKLSNALDWTPLTPLEDGLAKTADYYRSK
ncbi:SDR family NAD(P)-dependent oxidoreductase [Salipaludibacillus aurantiacus]|uniref:UDP-glucose 4-epimerase n=1 Tax=Salipaludibacillus aurantiacus TaxID=1601833 RepID=A0A1H9X4X0_9BACI|nr:SDR family NAD(P)-dependent oxidoreductase [Salipaludibacillus aurantiacus]SES41246.1 UDP-glucose 4-epimerase [Salipaludibacillus aurantiacus]